MMRKSIITISFLSLSGCTVGPDYTPPLINGPTAWHVSQGGSAGTNSTAPHTETMALESAWWKNFNDPLLDRLIFQAIHKNHDLKVTEMRLNQARAEMSKAAAVLLPQLDMMATVGRNRNTMPFPGMPLSPFNAYQIGFDASWEIDFFGGNRLKNRAATALYLAATENRNYRMVTLLGEVARAYIDIRHYQNQLALTKATITAQSNTVTLVHRQLAAGQANKLDMLRAESLFQSTQAQLPFYENQIAQASFRLELLLGEHPGALKELLTPQNTTTALEISDKPVGYVNVPQASTRLVLQAPVEVLSQRPDVRAAERQLAGATHLQGAAIADVYPKISLSSLLGVTSVEKSLLFDGNHNTWSLGGSFLTPIFHFGALRANIKKAEAQQLQALHQFEKVVLEALHEVESALSSYYREVEHRQILAQNAKLSREAVHLARRLYSEGFSSFLEVLDAERALYATESELAKAETAVSSHLVAIYKALGGGWQIALADTQNTPVKDVPVKDVPVEDGLVEKNADVTPIKKAEGTAPIKKSVSINPQS